MLQYYIFESYGYPWSYFIEKINDDFKKMTKEQALQELSDFGQEMDRVFRNEVLEEVAVEIEKLRGDTAASFAVFVRNMKR